MKSLMMLLMIAATAAIEPKSIAAMLAHQVAVFFAEAKNRTHCVRKPKIFVAKRLNSAESRAIWVMNKAKCWQFHKIGR